MKLNWWNKARKTNRRSSNKNVFAPKRKRRGSRRNILDMRDDDGLVWIRESSHKNADHGTFWDQSIVVKFFLWSSLQESQNFFSMISLFLVIQSKTKRIFFLKWVKIVLETILKSHKRWSQMYHNQILINQFSTNNWIQVRRWWKVNVAMAGFTSPLIQFYLSKNHLGFDDNRSDILFVKAVNNWVYTVNRQVEWRNTVQQPD